LSKRDTILHDGQVVEVLQDRYKIRIVARSACASCNLKGVCNPSDQAEKIIDAISNQDLKVHDKVIVELEERLGWKALFYGMLIPFVIMVTVLFTLSANMKGELLPALIGLASLVPYYLIIHLFRDKIEKEFVFNARKNTNKLYNII